METPVMPPFPPGLEILLVALLEFVFGLGYNWLVAWAHRNEIWSVFVSVIFGVTGTLVLPLVFWWDHDLHLWQAVLIFLVCFASSGMPMSVGSARRKVSHKRRPWPTAAARARENALMDLTVLAQRVADGQIEPAGIVNTLHEIKGILSSV